MRSRTTTVDERSDSVAMVHRTAHDVVEAERLLRSQHFAEAIRERPELLQQAVRSIETTVRDGEATLGQRLWQALLREPGETVVRCMTGDDAEGRLLRSNNPCSLLIGQTDPAERRRTWREAKEAL